MSKKASNKNKFETSLQKVLVGNYFFVFFSLDVSFSFRI
jgi:hypothetical protein